MIAIQTETLLKWVIGTRAGHPGVIYSQRRSSSFGEIGLPRATVDAFSKVARVTFAFWVVKILATTLGETGGDALSMTLNLGYGVSSLIFLGFFCITLIG